MDNLRPWSWAPNGGGAAGFSTAMMQLFEKECKKCELHSEVRAQCKHVRDFYDGHYPKAPPPEAWYTTPEGVPLCMDRQVIEPSVALGVGQLPGETPAPPENLPDIKKQYFVYNSDNNKIFVIYAEEIKNFSENIYTVNPLKNKVLEHLKETIFKL